MDQGQPQGQEEGQGYLLHSGAGDQLLLRPQAAEDGVPAGVVRRLAQLLEGQHRRGGQQEGEAQIEAQKQGQDLAAHGLLVEVQAGLHPQPAVLHLIGGEGVLHPVLRLLLVPGVVGGPDLAADLQLLGHLVGNHHTAQPQISGGELLLHPGEVTGHRSPVGGLAAAGEQGLAVGQADGGAGILDPGDRRVIVVKNGVLLPGQVGLLHAVLGQQGGKINRPLGVGVLVLYGDVKGGLTAGHGLDGVVQPDGAGGDAHGQQQKNTDHRLSQIGGVDLADPLAQGERIQVFEVELGAALDQTEDKAGQGFKHQQGPQGAQAQHGDAQHGENDRVGHAEDQQNGIGDEQADHPRGELDHRHPQGAQVQLLVSPPALHQVQQLGPGDLEAAEHHHQQEDKAEVHRCPHHSPGGEGQAEGVHPQGEHGQGEGGQPLGGQQAQPQAQDQGGQADEPGLQKQQPGHLPLAESQKQVGAQLPLPPPEQKAVGIQDQAGQHHRHKDREDVDAGLDDLGHGILALGQIDHGPLAVQGVEGVEETHSKGEGEQVHPVVPEGPAHIAEGQLREHLPSLLPTG